MRNKQINDTKTHFKMYKAGKMWITAGIVLGSSLLGIGLTSAPVAAAQTTTSAGQSASPAATSQTKAASSTTSTASSAGSVAAVPEAASSAASSITSGSGSQAQTSNASSSSSQAQTGSTSSNSNQTPSSSGGQSTSQTASSVSSSNSQAQTSANQIKPSAADSATVNNSSKQTVISASAPNNTFAPAATANTPAASTPKKNLNDFSNDNLVTMGDSITQGYNGQTTVSNPYPKQLATLLGLKSVNGTTYVAGGATMAGTTYKDFPQEMTKLLSAANLANVDLISIAYGINDLNYGTESLATIQQIMVTQLNKLLAARPDIKIYGILPEAAFKLPSTDAVGANGFSENDLINAEAAVYQSFGIPYLDWRTKLTDHEIVNEGNYETTLGDGVHPTQTTYNAIAARIASFMTASSPNSMSLHQSTYVPKLNKGWVQDNSTYGTGNWYYYADNGNKEHNGVLYTDDGIYDLDPVTGARLINTLGEDSNGLYYFGADGKAITGLKTINGATYYFQTTAAKNTFMNIGDKSYYFNSDGVSTTGYYTLNGNAYYLDSKTMQNVRNAYLDTPVGWMLFGNANNGAAVSGVQKWAGSYYYFDNVTHLKRTNEILQSQWGDWYGFGNDGRILTGVQKLDGTYYAFEKGTYRLIRNDYVQSQWGDWYLFGRDGAIQTGVQKWGGTYYYFDPTTYLKRANAYLQSQWGDWYLFGKNGQIQTGVQKWGGTYYYFDPTTYVKRTNAYLQSQWGDWYLFGSNGKIQSGMQKWGGTYYYFDPVTHLKRTNAYLESGGNWYLFSNSGAIVAGWAKWQGQTYYFDPKTHIKLTGTHVINGKTYHFSNSGALL
ncbi:hypothetical protein BSQ39_05530 [Loigolactobacillus backii]|uniref:GDSL-type esterase/lipase family protein n=1 Tax=Loigolactobacillus backii TaxID=375175 RepID=UPI000C1C8607|nr:GDSL-type esterase/lipase family protein [Loigolactobacillus backii]PIO83074.1 hypothetical protein BSQ39_05530 [Loigolactobacillus backii]